MGETTRSRIDKWTGLLSNHRIYGQSFPPGEFDRSEFQRDHDRIIFSSAFRRLQDKTQVFPLSRSDYTRNRLTHSLEVSSVGRTMGTLVGQHLVKLGITCEPYEIGTIVATAALAHDIGNPPFGHSGEAAIQSWAKRRLPPISEGKPRPEGTISLHMRRKDSASIKMSPEELADFHHYEGNSQGLRILIRTAVRERHGGLRPTLATLGAMVKYPRPALLPQGGKPSTISLKKPGYFQSEKAAACKAFRMLGMAEAGPGMFSRHPLAFLTEAADDACYAIADIDDAFKLGILTFDEVRAAIVPLASRDRGFDETTHPTPRAKFARMRASALAVLVRECTEAFCDSLDELESGTLDVPILKRTRVAKEHEQLKALAKEKVYRHERVLQIEYAGYSTIGGLLDMFYCALCESRDEPIDDTLRGLLPIEFVWRKKQSKLLERSKSDPFQFYLNLMTPYERLLVVTDYVSGMTDGFAVQLYQRLTGIRLPD
ncbi:MAG: dNTP triphosphohydrolase [Acidobacteriia bacterium]|nr:dNTP triphosphohydrolase [Terriglobia bacterium]